MNTKIKTLALGVLLLASQARAAIGMTPTTNATVASLLRLADSVRVDYKDVLLYAAVLGYDFETERLNAAYFAGYAEALSIMEEKIRAEAKKATAVVGPRIIIFSDGSVGAEPAVPTVTKPAIRPSPRAARQEAR
jgi:hypothetical protein